MDIQEMQVEMVALDDLVSYAKNARTHSAEQIRQIADSITEFGWTNPILVDRDQGVIAGHGRILAGRLLGIKRVPVIALTGLTDAQKRAYIIADNRLALSGGWDLDILREELADLDNLDFDLGLLGFSEDELADLLPEEIDDPLCDPDEIPEPQVEVVSVVGDRWLCGNHVVMCGNSLDLPSVEILLGGKDVKADMVWTDPPYLMNYQGSMSGDGFKGGRHKDIINDNLSKKDGEQFLRDIAGVIKAKCRGSWYVSFYRLGIEWLMRALTDTGLKWRNLIIWRKNHINLSNSDYKSVYEPLIYGWADDYHPVLYGWNNDHRFFGEKGSPDVYDIEIPSVWEIAKTKKNVLHPTVKPVALVERALLNSSKGGNVVLDLFGGSGTTLIAAEMTGRHARIMELAPEYADVIVRRFHQYTGKVPIHAETGKEFPVERLGTMAAQP